MSSADSFTTSDLRKLAGIAGYVDKEAFCAFADGTCTVFTDCEGSGWDQWTPHTDIAQAFEILKGLESRGAVWELSNSPECAELDRDGYSCAIAHCVTKGLIVHETGDSIAEAICRSALRINQENSDE